MNLPQPSVKPPNPRDMVAALDRPTELAENLPRAAYTDPDFFRLEIERVFGRSWTYVGAAGEMPNAGDAIPLTLGDMPIVLVRQRDMTIKAFHNVCRHRGPILVRQPVQAQSALICPYHAWAYDLDGELKRTPAYMGSGRHDSGPLDKSCMGSGRDTLRHLAGRHLHQPVGRCRPVGRCLCAAGGALGPS